MKFRLAEVDPENIEPWEADSQTQRHAESLILFPGDWRKLTGTIYVYKAPGLGLQYFRKKN